MILIYRTRPSESARDLVEALGNCRRYRDTSTRPPRNGDKIVCWGEAWEGSSAGYEILNGGPIVNKYQDAVKLKAEGVPTVEVSRTRPNVQPRVADRGVYNVPANRLTVEQVRAQIAAMNAWLDAPLPTIPQVEWLGRMNNHIGGNDLLNPPRTPDFYSKKEDLIEEYRIHCFKGRSIRAGRKVQGVEGRTTPSHQWIRSHDGGWRISYDGFESTKAMRKVARNAIKALGLDFGAVDIGKTRDNKLIVLEVNRAPGLEGGTIEAYARAVQAWANGDFDEEVEDRAA